MQLSKSDLEYVGNSSIRYIHSDDYRPASDDPNHPGDHVQIGTDVHYRNVYMFTESVQEHASHPARRDIIARDFNQLLRGDADTS